MKKRSERVQEYKSEKGRRPDLESYFDLRGFQGQVGGRLIFRRALLLNAERSSALSPRTKKQGPRTRT
jgi:hypothetical protein